MEETPQPTNGFRPDEPVFSTAQDKHNEEYLIHVAISDHLNGWKRVGKEIQQGQQPFPGMLITHAYQGRSKGEGFFLKRLGVRPGIADLLCWYKTPSGYGCAFMEVKKPSGIQSPAQRKVMGHCQSLGIPYVIVRSVADAHAYFVRIGLKAAHNAVREPDVRTISQKRQDAFDMFRP